MNPNMAPTISAGIAQSKKPVLNIYCATSVNSASPFLEAGQNLIMFSSIGFRGRGTTPSPRPPRFYATGPRLNMRSIRDFDTKPISRHILQEYVPIDRYYITSILTPSTREPAMTTFERVLSKHKKLARAHMKKQVNSDFGRRTASNLARRERDQVRRDCGLVRGRDSLGRVIWE